MNFYRTLHFSAYTPSVRRATRKSLENTKKMEENTHKNPTTDVMIQQTVFCFPAAQTAIFFLSFVVNNTLSSFAKGTLCFVTLCVTTEGEQYMRNHVYIRL